MEDDIYIFPTASGFLTRFTDFQRENPDRFVVNVSTGDNGSGDDLYISGYDTTSGLAIDFFISAIGDEFRFLTTNPNDPTPQDEAPTFDDSPVFDIPEFMVANFPEMFASGGFGPVSLLPGGFFYGGDGGGYGFDFGGGGGGGPDAGHYGGYFTDSLDAQWLAEVGFIY